MDKNRWIMPYIKQFRMRFLLVILLGALTVLFSGGLMFTSGYLITKASTKPETILMVYVPIVGVRAFGIGRAALAYVESLAGHHFILNVLSNMRVRLYNLLEPQALFLKSRFSTGDLLGTLSDDIEYLQDFYLKTLFPSIVSLMIYATIVIGTGAFSLTFALVLLVLIGLLVFVGPAISYLYMKKKNERVKQGKHTLYQQLTDNLFGMSEVLFSGRHLEMIAQYDTKQQELQQIEAKKKSFINWRGIGNQVILGLVVAFAVYWTNGMAVTGEIPATFIAAFALMLLSVVETFFSLSDAVSESTRYQDSINRLRRLEADTEPESNDQPVAEVDFGTNVAIDFNHVAFQYHAETQLIDDFHLHIGPGEKIAILGPSGAGKSTVLKLLQGAMKPSDGAVLINDHHTNEHSDAIPQVVSMLNQKAYLFHTTVFNNIHMGNTDATEAEVYQAAKQVGLHEMIISLPKGYQTNIHETGQRFSGGERQRIALARILLKKTPIVVMDEPTIGLDPITENHLLETIFDTLSDKTMIWVTHHLAGMAKMDRILFMDEGKITMEGSHQQLLAEEDRYRRLFQLDYPVQASDPLKATM